MTGITHPFVSGISDGSDPTLVKPSDWNSGHAVDSVAPSGLTGSTAASRYVGATASGHPTTGAHLVGDWIIAQNGIRWTCTTAGTPGVWTQEPGTGGGGGTPASTVTGPDAFGDPAVVGTATDYARSDHDHGLPSAPSGSFAAGGDLSGTSSSQTVVGIQGTAVDALPVDATEYLDGTGHWTTPPGTGGASGGTPDLTLSTTNVAGSATTFIREDDQIAVFDATNPVTQAYSDSPSPGSAAVAARRDHKHGMPAASGGGGGGALVLLEQHTASSSATLDFTTAITSTYDEYMIEMLNLVPATNAVDLRLEVSTDGGSTWDTTSGHYSWEALRSNTSGAVSSGSTSDIAICLSANTLDHVQNDANNGGVHGSFRLIAPGSAIYKYLFGNVSLYYGSSWVTAFIGGRYLQTAAVNALRFLFSSGNIASGTIRVYGIAKS